MRLFTIPLAFLAILCLLTGAYIGLQLGYSTRSCQIRERLESTPHRPEATDPSAANPVADLRSRLVAERGTSAELARAHALASGLALGLAVVAAAALVALAVCLDRLGEARRRLREIESLLPAP